MKKNIHVSESVNAILNSDILIAEFINWQLSWLMEIPEVHVVSCITSTNLPLVHVSTPNYSSYLAFKYDKQNRTASLFLCDFSLKSREIHKQIDIEDYSTYIKNAEVPTEKFEYVLFYIEQAFREGLFQSTLIEKQLRSALADLHLQGSVKFT